MIHAFEGDTADSLWRKVAQGLVNGDSYSTAPSRLGPIREYLHCSLHLSNPRERWVLSRQPPLNPAFAIAEVIWILQGRNDAAFLNYWNPALPKFAGLTDSYYGAYGHRLRRNLGFDQIEQAYQILSLAADSRQVVLQIWDGAKDLPFATGQPRDPDIPCNVVSMLKVRDDRLHWLQIMRSNDLYLGTPHNLVQFTSLQEIVAGWLGIEVGSFVLMCDSLHLYEHDVANVSIASHQASINNPDSLALAKSDFDRVLSIVGSIADDLRADGLTPTRLMQSISSSDVPTSWRNLLAIVAADSARRRGWQTETEAVSEICTNPVLSAAWRAWVARRSS
jgi:thymidylate synthase